VDLLVPTILGLVVALIMVPSVRLLLFPGLAKIDSNGKTSAEGQVQSEDSLTGAPENHKGEAAEREAKNLVDSFATVAMESAAAKYGQAVTEDTDKPALIESLEAAEAAAGTPTSDSPEDKTKKPMKKKVANATDNVMRILSDITDIYEKFAK
jgi:type I site-specific restriction-modification system R (restriction) subunit